MPQTVPLQPVPRQTVQVQLGGQACSLNVNQLDFCIVMDVYVNNVPIILSVIAENLNRIVRSLYLGFSGDFVFFDSQGVADPVFYGLGSRWQLVYLSESDLPAGEG